MILTKWFSTYWKIFIFGFKIFYASPLPFYLVHVLTLNHLCLSNSYVGNISLFREMEEKLQQVPDLLVFSLSFSVFVLCFQLVVSMVLACNLLVTLNCSVNWHVLIQTVAKVICLFSTLLVGSMESLFPFLFQAFSATS